MSDKTEKNSNGMEVDVQYPDQSPTPRFMIQDYWVDLLGGLLPGTLISVAAVVSIVPAIVLLLHAFSLEYDTSLLSLVRRALAAARSTPNMIWFGVATILFSLFYVLGHMFYRQDPKQPNQESFVLLREEIIEKNKNKKLDKAALEEILEKELACRTRDECEFPFPFFDRYLENRGLDHLQIFVPWSKNREHRTKNYINILKMRLRFYFPNRCGTIIRNEAHIRLASSTWYVGRAMDLFAKISIAISACSLLFSFAIGLPFLASNVTQITWWHVFAQHLGVIIIAIFIFKMGDYVRTRIEKFLHYQRMREVVHVMETAYTAFRQYPDLLCPPFDPPPQGNRIKLV